MSGEQALREALRSLAPDVEVSGVWEAMHEKHARRLPGRRMRKVLVSALALAVLALVVLFAHQALRPSPSIVITDETLAGGSGPVAGSDSFDNSVADGQLVDEGWIKIYGMSTDYVLYAKLPADGTSVASTLCAYSLSKRQTQVLADGYDWTLPTPRVTEELAAWVDTRPEGNVVVVANLLTGESTEYGSDPAVLLLNGTNLIVEDHGNGLISLSVYDLTTGAKRDIYQTPTPAAGYGYEDTGFLQPSTDGQRVAWSAPGERSREVYGYDLATDATSQLTANDEDDFLPQVSGSLLTWLRGTQASADVYLFDLASTQETRIGEGAQSGWTLGGWGPTITTGGPQTDGRYVAWCSTQPPFSRVMLYEAGTGKTTDLSGQEESDGNVRVAAGRLTWLRLGPAEGESHAVTYGPETDAEGQILAGNMVEQVFGNGSWAAWFEYSQVGGPSDLRAPRGLVVMPVSSTK